MSRWDGPHCEKTCLRWFTNNTGADQLAHPRSLNSAYVIRYLESIVVKLAPYKIPLFLLVSVAEETVLSLPLSEAQRQVLSRQGPDSRPQKS